jgi:hypothetical protein
VGLTDDFPEKIREPLREAPVGLVLYRETSSEARLDRKGAGRAHLSCWSGSAGEGTIPQRRDPLLKLGADLRVQS